MRLEKLNGTQPPSGTRKMNREKKMKASRRMGKKSENKCVIKIITIIIIFAMKIRFILKYTQCKYIYYEPFLFIVQK